MIINYLILILTCLAFLGYSIPIKKIIFYSKNNYEYINDYDIFYGLILIYILSFIFNIFLPLIYFTEIFFLLGLILFVYYFNKIKFSKNIVFFFITLLSLVFITYNTGTVYDTNLYHLQILNWNSYYKLNFGLANLEIRFGTNSFWQFILSIFNNLKYDFQHLFLLNCLPISILFNRFYFSKSNQIKLSSIYIFCCLNYILLYSILHTSSNGLIINSLRSPEVDTVAMFFFIFSVYFFLKFFEDFKYSDYVYCFIFSFLAAITKISHIGVLILPISLLYFSKKKFDRILVVSFTIFFIWSLKNFFLSGCWVFPISFTCYPSYYWTTPVEEIELFTKIASSYPRAHSANQDFMNFDYTLNSYAWLYPWLKSYFFATSFFIIFILILVTSFLFIGFQFFQKKKYIFFKKIFFILAIFYLFNFYIWFNAPELRYGYGLFISLSCLIFSYSFKQIINKFHLISKFQFLPILFLLILIFQNFQNIYFFKEINLIRFDNSNIKFFKKINDIDIYKSDGNDGFCNNFKEPCIIYPKEIGHRKYYDHNFFYRISN